MKPLVKHCAIYTRKSSEEGLEQDFNSLDAQRESCLAYIQSQKSEGWHAVKAHYDDGGFSGGNMERPALKRLLEDIQDGIVHIVVVYKIDRLTRSLMDFAKLVEVFDRHGVTFVSVTQSFNTTTSMGRLTLNVLLSFAQFEREVTGERIRDKIAASKKKGMWMGGATPIGYDCINKQLLLNKEEAAMVNLIFEKYLELGCVRKLKEYLDNNDLRTKVRKSKKGRISGGVKFSRGLLYKILVNPVYIGQIKHKDKVYDGQHAAVLPIELWDKVQKRLTQQAPISRGADKMRFVGNLLTGLLFDSHGNRYSPSFTSKGKIQYRYYVNSALLQGKPVSARISTRLPAHETERAIEDALRGEFTSMEKTAAVLGLDRMEDDELLQAIVAGYESLDMREIVRAAVSKVVVGEDDVRIQIDSQKLLGTICVLLNLGQKKPVSSATAMILLLLDTIKPKTGAFLLEPADAAISKKDPFDRTPQEIKNWVRGIIWRGEHFGGMTLRQIADRDNCSEALVGKLIAESLAAV